MGIEIEPYSPGHVDAVRAFNERLKAGGCAFSFPKQPESAWLPKAPGEPLYEEYFVAAEAEEVRGGYILKHQPFSVAGGVQSVGSLYLPLSEGTVNRQYSRLGAQLFFDALHRQPLLYSLGMGSFENPYPRLLKAAGWPMFALPFHFRVVNAKAFCRNITFLRKRPLMRAGLDLMAATGLGTIAFKAVHALCQNKPGRAQALTVETVREFEPWVDDIWKRGLSGCQLAAVRDCAALRRLYPASKERYLKLRVNRGAEAIGWVVALDTPVKEHKQFGNMRLGSIIDGFAATGGEAEVVLGATQFLERRGVDLVVSNQAHRAWNAAFDEAGYLRGPSNFIFAASPKLVELIGGWEAQHTTIHCTRGDGEGPSHL